VPAPASASARGPQHQPLPRQLRLLAPAPASAAPTSPPLAGPVFCLRPRLLARAKEAKGPRSRLEPGGATFFGSGTSITLQRAQNSGLHPRSRGAPPRLGGLRVEPEPELLLEPSQREY
jgi:hypothetical protein